MVKIIVAGSRNFNNYSLLESYLDIVINSMAYKPVTIISGTARGADQLGERYAENKGHGIERYPAEWDKYGRSAGYKRNEQMAEVADVLVAFWDGQSRGTMHMINIAKNKGLRVFVYKF